MKKIIFAGLAFAFLISCNSTNENGDADSLNQASKKCIRIANEAEANKDIALANGNRELAEQYQATMDSALRENVLIGTKLMELEH